MRLCTIEVTQDQLTTKTEGYQHDKSPITN